MLSPSIHRSPCTKTLPPLHKPFISGDGSAAFTISTKPILGRKTRYVRDRHVSRKIKAISTLGTEKSTSVKTVITVQKPTGGVLSFILDPDKGLDEITDLFGKSVFVELVAAELDSKTGLVKPTIKVYARETKDDDKEVKYETEFVIPEDFGAVGAVLIENEHHNEMFIKHIVIEGFPGGPVNITCNSWVHPKFDNPQKRIFFIDKSYLPSKTPSGLKKFREKELLLLRGDGLGERKNFERIYDYDVYNDIGDPDASDDAKRPVLGGKEHPYPRRCRTGRPRSEKDPFSEKRSSDVYVPRDEAFSQLKSLTFSAKTVYSLLHAVIPSLEGTFTDSEQGFPYFTAIDSLFNEGVHLPELQSGGSLGGILPRLVRAVSDVGNDVLRFETPQMIDRDKFAWFRDEEFARQTLAGLNPCSIKLVTEWPLKSKLDPGVYGPAESAFTKEKVEQAIRGFITFEEALRQKKLFIVDYHDILLPYVNKVREIKGTTLYGSRTLFFLMPTGTLRPLAIELTRPPVDGKPQWKEVFAP